ncbi:N-alpha-acetyltransferase 80-like [Ara ararauna]
MGCVSEELSLAPLHQRLELLQACAGLLREERGKSRASRLHTLQRSSDSFPTCLLLLRSRGTAEAPCQLVGHVRLSLVAGRPHSLFVESVVVARALRGQGYGRRLMEATEQWARARGFGCLHLSTHDRQRFCAHVGFVLAQPVQSVAFLSPTVPTEVLRLFSTHALRAGPVPRALRSLTSVPCTHGSHCGAAEADSRPCPSAWLLLFPRSSLRKLRHTWLDGHQGEYGRAAYSTLLVGWAARSPPAQLVAAGARDMALEGQ